MTALMTRILRVTSADGQKNKLLYTDVFEVRDVYFTIDEISNEKISFFFNSRPEID
jgi:hypothetical protein